MRVSVDQINACGTQSMCEEGGVYRACLACDQCGEKAPSSRAFERRLLHHVSVMVARFRSRRLRLASAKRLSASEPVQVSVQMEFSACTGQSAIIIETGTRTLLT